MDGSIPPAHFSSLLCEVNNEGIQPRNNSHVNRPPNHRGHYVLLSSLSHTPTDELARWKTPLWSAQKLKLSYRHSWTHHRHDKCTCHFVEQLHWSRPVFWLRLWLRIHPPPPPQPQYPRAQQPSDSDPIPLLPYGQNSTVSQPQTHRSPTSGRASRTGFLLASASMCWWRGYWRWDQESTPVHQNGGPREVFVRVAFCKTDEVLELAAERLGELLEEGAIGGVEGARADIQTVS